MWESKPAKATLPRQEPFTCAELWEAFFVSRDGGFLNKLLVHYLPVATRMAGQMAARFNQRQHLDDLVQHAALGLREAIGTFDPTRGAAFEAYCGLRVRGAMLDFLRRSRFDARRWREDRLRLIGLKHEDAAIADPRSHDPADPVTVRDLREFLLRGLSTIERHVILLYYYENRSLREIGEALNLCESRVSQIHQRVLNRMRERIGRSGEQ